MRLIVCFYTLLLWTGYSTLAQSVLTRGRIVDSRSGQVLEGVLVQLVDLGLTSVTDIEGEFELEGPDTVSGPHSLRISKKDYISQLVRIVISAARPIVLDPVFLEFDVGKAEEQIGLISISDNELLDDRGVVYNSSGLLQAERDVFLSAAAFDFSGAFFRPRGYDNANGTLLINGVEMNGMLDGRPQWASWGGLNDAQRVREVRTGLRASDHTFGDLAGSTNIVMRASGYRQGARISAAASNRTYQRRIMGSYNSGPGSKGWAFSVLASRRFGEQGFIEGTSFSANSFFAAVERELGKRHSLNLLMLYTPYLRGRSTALTDEVIGLKGYRYNPLWGYQRGVARSSRNRQIEKPLLILNHYWDISENTSINANLAYVFGRTADSRLANSGQRNPYGNFYQRMPSYFLRDPNPTAYDFQLALHAANRLKEDGQLNWDHLYRSNSVSSSGLSTYFLQDDVRKGRQINGNVLLHSRIGEHLILNGSLSYRQANDEYFAEISDLLGGVGYLDIDYFGSDPEKAQSDLQNPNRVVKEGERFGYNYRISSKRMSGFVQGQFDYRNIDFFVSALLSSSSYQRTGLYQNGYFPENGRSLGVGRPTRFFNYGLKAGATYNISGKHLLEVNGAYFSKPPTIRNSFANIRQNNDLVDGLQNQFNKAFELNYLYRGATTHIRLTAYYTRITDQTDLGFYFTQNALGNVDNSAFVQEVVTGIDTINSGLELGLETALYPGFSVKAAAAYGNHFFADDALLYLAGDDFDDPNTAGFSEGNDLFNRGKRRVSLTNYRQAAGPELAGQIGVEYRSPTYWWFGASLNYFDRIFVDISKLRRTPDFFTDLDGQPFNDYDQDIAMGLLQQEQLEPYYLLNVVGGKSWRFGRVTLGVFAAVSNLLGQEFKTGGFEDSRRSSYRQQLEERNRRYGPLFGNRYFPGYGTTSYLNLYLRY